jgi:hypothetical protein
MNTLELLNNYPHTTEVVREWFMNKMVESFKDETVPEDFKKFMRQQGVPNDRLVKLIGTNPRNLFDIFDDNGLFIETMYMEKQFHYTIVEDGEVSSSNTITYNTRKECDGAAVEQAFKMLNEKLNNEGPDSATSDTEVPTEE